MRMDIKKFRILFIGIFLVMLGGFTVWSLANPKKAFSDMENRSLQQMPKVTKKSVLSGKFQKKYETFLADQIFLRDQWVNGYANMQRFLGKKEINGVYLGKNGYLIEKYEEKDFDADLETSNIARLSDFLDTASEGLGAEHVSCLFVPSKIDVLTEKLPAYAEKYSGAEVALQVKKQVEHGERVLNLGDTLSGHAKEYIYYRTDHHWTTLGAYYGFSEYQKLRGESLPDLNAYEQEVVFDDFLGTTYNKAHVRTKPDEVSLFHTASEKVSVEGNDGEFTSDSFYFKKAAREGFDRYQIFFSKNTKKIVIKTGSRTGKTLLVVKDSFANCFVPFLAESYDEIIMVDPRYTKAKIGTIFREYKEITDVLVLFNIEKFRQDTHLSVLKLRSGDLKKEEEKNGPEKTEGDDKGDDEGDDIFDGLISLD